MLGTLEFGGEVFGYSESELSLTPPNAPLPGSIGLLLFGAPVWITNAIINPATNKFNIAGHALISRLYSPANSRSFNVVGRAYVKRLNVI